MRNLRIIDRDLFLFRYLFEQDFVSREWIKKFIWQDLKDSYVTSRLWRLNRSGYIKKHFKVSTGSGTVIMADKEAEKLMKNRRIRERMLELDFFGVNFYNDDSLLRHYEVRDSLNKGEFDHDMDVSEVRFRLEDYIDYWISERILWKHNSNAKKENRFRRISDGIMRTSLNNQDMTVAIEVEGHIKKDHRYRNIFDTYYYEDRIDAVFYVTTDDQVYDRLNKKLLTSRFRKSTDTKLRYDFYEKFFTIKLEELRRGRLIFWREEDKSHINLGESDYCGNN
ncbi:MAG: hypothetical protein ACOCV1_08055 [Bacillota bacterium]